MTTNNFISYDANNQQLLCHGAWDITHLPAIKSLLKKNSFPKSGALIIDGSDISKMDSAGAWLLYQLSIQLKKKGLQVHFENFTPPYQRLLELVEKEIQAEKVLPFLRIPPWVARVGKETIEEVRGFHEFIAFVGRLASESWRVLFKKEHRRWGELTAVIYNSGYQALPIIALLSFMIGVVLSYQMGLQLRQYGANIYIIDLLGLTILREFGPLLTAIMVAGRTGSAFTAQLGTMKVNEEIDALSTMGVTPDELVLLPKILGLLIVVPLLSMWANIFGLIGGMVMAKNMLNVGWHDFLNRFTYAIHLKTLMVGIGKAPVFALLIATIGCYQGMKVQGGANSVGANTTRSVVLSIFFIIITDAAFSVIFSRLNI